MARARSSPQPGGELALIEQIRRRAGVRKGALRLGIGDDCAILRIPRGQELVVTTDFSLEGRHFTRDRHSPQSIGHRALARGLSDLAAMGAKPLAAFLSLALPKSLARNRQWLDGFLDGLLTLASRHATPLAGGDTSESPSGHILLDILLLGTVPQGRALRRDAARPGDLLYVTGALGGAAAELHQVLRMKASDARPSHPEGPSDHPHLFPTPRLAVGQALLRRRLAHAAIDLSDGLSTDLTHLCQASGVSAEIDDAALPFHPLTLSNPSDQRLHAALHGGEDYELLFAALPRTRMPRTLAGVPITRIGRILKSRPRQPRITLLQPDHQRTPLHPEGWQHLTG